MRHLRLVLPAASFLLMLAPTTMATEEIAFAFDQGHEEMLLPDTGQMIHKIRITAVAKEFTCLKDPAVFFVQATAGGFEKWAGASLNPDEARFTVRPNDPGTQPKNLDAAEVRLELKWNVDDRPKTNARQVYEIRFVEDSFKLDSGGPCTPLPKPNFGEPLQITIHMNDVVDNVTAQGDCQAAPELPECQPDETIIPREDSPGLDLVPLALAVVGTAMMGRRRR